MKLVIRRVIDKVCCKDMQEALNKKIITHHIFGEIPKHNAWNFYLGDDVIFYCPWCGEECF